jgi:hypothetical protein
MSDSLVWRWTAAVHGFACSVSAAATALHSPSAGLALALDSLPPPEPSAWRGHGASAQWSWSWAAGSASHCSSGPCYRPTPGSPSRACSCSASSLHWPRLAPSASPAWFGRSDGRRRAQHSEGGQGLSAAVLMVFGGMYGWLLFLCWRSRPGGEEARAGDPGERNTWPTGFAYALRGAQCRSGLRPAPGAQGVDCCCRPDGHAPGNGDGPLRASAGPQRPGEVSRTVADAVTDTLLGVAIALVFGDLLPRHGRTRLT